MRRKHIVNSTNKAKKCSMKYILHGCKCSSVHANVVKWFTIIAHHNMNSMHVLLC